MRNENVTVIGICPVCGDESAVLLRNVYDPDWVVIQCPACRPPRLSVLMALIPHEGDQ